MNEQSWNESGQLVLLRGEEWLAVIGALISNIDNAAVGQMIATRVAKQLYFDNNHSRFDWLAAGRAALDNPPLIRSNGGSVYE